MWGHDFRPDYLFIRRALERARRAGGAGHDRHGNAVECRGDRRGARAPPSSWFGRAFIGRTSATTWSAPRTARSGSARCSRHLRGLDERGGDRLRAVAALLRGDRPHAARARNRRGALPRRASSPTSGRASRSRSSPGALRSSSRRPRSAWASTRPNVRLVALANLPDSLESYVQMVGRAGRDGRPSDTVLLAGDADATALRRFALGDVPTPDDPAARVPRRPRGGRDGDAEHPRGRRRRDARPARPRRDARAGGPRAAGLRRRTGDADRAPSRRRRGRRRRRRAARPLRARGGGTGGAHHRVRGSAALPSPPGGGALRRDARGAVRRVRRLRPACDERRRCHAPPAVRCRTIRRR